MERVVLNALIMEMARLSERCSAARNVFSAKGAAFTASPPQDGFAVANLRQSPQESCDPKCDSAESSIHFYRDLVSIIGASLISTGIIFRRVKPRGIEARFQRLMYQQSNAWGDAPG